MRNMSNTEFKEIKNIILKALDDLKTLDVVSIDVSKKSNFTDLLLIGTGTSSTHIKAISNEVIEKIKKNGFEKTIRGVEVDNEWVLIDLYDIVINLMINETREFYGLEKLWSIDNSYKPEITSS